MQKRRTQQLSSTHLVAEKGRFQTFLSVISFFLLLASLPLKADTKAQTLKVVAITEIVAHPSLQQAKAGILQELKRAGFEVGKNLKLIEENAQGSIANANLIAKRFIGLKPDLIIAISTPSAQAVRSAAKGTSIPIVFSSVSDPVGAGLIESLEQVPTQITGAMDGPSLTEMQALLKTLVPKVKTLGLLYNGGEANSAKTIASLKSLIDSNIKLVESSVPSSNMVPEAMRMLVQKVDAIYIPSDNTVFSALPKVIQIAKEQKIPLLSSDPDSVRLGVFACYGYTQLAVGETAGAMAAKILQGEKLSQLKVRTPAKADVFVNKKTAGNLGIAFPPRFHNVDIIIVE